MLFRVAEPEFIKVCRLCRLGSGLRLAFACSTGMTEIAYVFVAGL